MILHRISPNQSLHVKADLTVVDSAHMICIFTVNRIPDMSLIKKTRCMETLLKPKLL